MDSMEVLVKSILDRLQAVGDRVEDIACKQATIEALVTEMQKKADAGKRWWNDLSVKYLAAAAAALIMLGRYTVPDTSCTQPQASVSDTTKHSKRLNLDSLLLNKALGFEGATKEK